MEMVIPVFLKLFRATAPFDRLSNLCHCPLQLLPSSSQTWSLVTDNRPTNNRSSRYVRECTGNYGKVQNLYEATLRLVRVPAYYIQVECSSHVTTYFRTFVRTFESKLCRGSNIQRESSRPVFESESPLNAKEFGGHTNYHKK